MKMNCPYCGEKASLQSSAKVYGDGFEDFGMLYVCEKYPRCDAYVGCHKGTTNPKGSLANAPLRALRKKAHFYFDALWKEKIRRGTKKKLARGLAYGWLSDLLNIPRSECHIAWMDEDRCRLTIDFCKPHYERLFGRGKR